VKENGIPNKCFLKFKNRTICGDCIAELSKLIVMSPKQNLELDHLRNENLNLQRKLKELDESVLKTKIERLEREKRLLEKKITELNTLLDQAEERISDLL
jgi:peptidoglycan hydrolase CwlO-like protein